ncbi:MAG TPA: DUF1801 domain-containing protein [Nitrososphaerales archaeon]|nr:DUF1801 domain-containing protein [Nitrososphaerales archaeon]
MKTPLGADALYTAKRILPAMNGNTKKVRSVDEYTATAPKDAQVKLSEIRTIVRKAAPAAVEGISYNMPFYKFYGPLAGFAAFNDHISLFGIVSEGERALLRGYESTKGTIHFPLSKPLPKALIVKLLKARVKRKEEAREN